MESEKPLYKIAYRIYKKKERKYFDKAAHIISLTEKGKEELVNVYHLPAEKITVIPAVPIWIILIIIKLI
jgi:hypothetical protein